MVYVGSKLPIIRDFTGKSPVSKHRSQKSGVRKVKVLVQRVVLSRDDRVFEAVGTGKARLSAEIYPAVSEEVREVLFQAQGRVKKGELLVQLDDKDEILALELARVQYQDAKALLERYLKAVQEGAVSQAELDGAQAAHDAARVAIEQARLSIEDRKITAPFDGVVGIPRVDPGDRVNLSTLITGLDDRRVLHLDFEIPEALAGKLQDAQSASREVVAYTPAYPAKEFLAKLSAQESRIDPLRRTLTARAEIRNDKDLLRPGMSFRTRWEIRGLEYPTLPEISLQWSREGSYLWVIRERKSHRVIVRVIARKDARILVEGDLQVGELVVIEGIQRLREGLDVEILGIHGDELPG